MIDLQRTACAAPYPGTQGEKRMNRTLTTAIALVTLLAASVAWACDYPQRADVPDGAMASKEEMIAGQRAVKSYMSAMNNYLSCIEAAEQETIATNGNTDENAKQQKIEMYNKKYNAAVDEMNLVAEEFNMQVRAYKQRNN